MTDKLQWKNYPRSMLRARCIAEGIRAVYPLAIGGMLIVEEAKDIEDETIIDGTATRVDNVVLGPTPKATAKTEGPVVSDQAKAATVQSQSSEPTGTVAAELPASSAASSETGEIITAGRVKIMRARMVAHQVTEDQIQTKFGKPLEQLLMSDSAAIQAFVETKIGA